VNYVAGDPRDQLAHVGFSVVGAGLVVGSGGNLSARIPGTDEFWVTAAGTWLDRLGSPDFCRVNLATGSVVGAPPTTEPTGGSNARQHAAEPTSELPLHLATYRVRPDVNAIVHLHPQTTILLDAIGERIRLVSTDHAFYLRRIVATPFRQPGSTALAELVAAAVGDGTNCVILGHHGCSVLGETVELAHKRALYLEEAARLTYRALGAGGAATLPECPAGADPLRV
jgi:L-fuculose-phosphate aldolase